MQLTAGAAAGALVALCLLGIPSLKSQTNTEPRMHLFKGAVHLRHVHVSGGESTGFADEHGLETRCRMGLGCRGWPSKFSFAESAFSGQCRMERMSGLVRDHSVVIQSPN